MIDTPTARMRRSPLGGPSPTVPLNHISSSRRNSMTIPQQFADIIRRFKEYSHHIRRVLKETDRSYNDIRNTRVLTTDKITEMELSSSDREYLNGLETRSLTMILLSQTYMGKCRFVNELLTDVWSLDTSVSDFLRIIRVKIENHPTNGATMQAIEISQMDDFNSSTNTLVNGTDNHRSSTTTSQAIHSTKDDLKIFITSMDQKSDIDRIASQMIETMFPMFIYIIDEEILSDDNIDQLKHFRSIFVNEPIYFVRVDQPDTSKENSNIQLFRQLCALNFLTSPNSESTDSPTSPLPNDMLDNGLIGLTHFLNYIRTYVDRLLIRAVSILQQSHEICLNLFNDSAFDMARDMLVTPTRLNYAREKERKLYESLLDLTNSKQNEIQRLIMHSVREIQERLCEDASVLELPGIELNNDFTVKNIRDLRKCTSIIQDFVLLRLNETIANKLLDSINVLHDNYVGTLKRCVFSLETNGNDESELSASKALQDTLHAAYQVNIALSDNSNLLRTLLDKMREFFRTFSWNNLPRIDADFKRSVVSKTLDDLAEVRLAKSVCTQLNDRIRSSHEHFETLLKRLEDRHSDRLKSTEDIQQRVRKDCTPKIAKLLLESTSLKDLIQFGLPEQGREVGRGQYGVVYECKSWADQKSCVLKSVIPPDDRHWNDLALEFHYLRRIPDHPRIAKLIGSVIDYRNPDQPAVLLIMERLKRDLYHALRNGLDFAIRMRIALDVVEGIRYLHCLGLVHRDIKLKNVLLDDFNRARLTDLGFCKPEVMMSGSLVGTPIHMSPELFTSKYDHTVDVYAFGILFWYICSNKVELPRNFNVCPSKDVLWTEVKRGVRPERLADFSEECWDIMTQCWDSEPSKRPYLGEVEDRIEQILIQTRPSSPPRTTTD